MKKFVIGSIVMIGISAIVLGGLVICASMEELFRIDYTDMHRRIY